MRQWGWLGLAGLFLVVPWAGSSPVQPLKPSREDIAPFGAVYFVVPCKAAERTCVIGSSIKAGLLGLYVYDPHGNCVARDEFDEYGLAAGEGEQRRPATDEVAVEWFPPAGLSYTVELRNASPRNVPVQMAFR
jgi:hypothetical protein